MTETQIRETTAQELAGKITAKRKMLASAKKKKWTPAGMQALSLVITERPEIGQYTFVQAVAMYPPYDSWSAPGIDAGTLKDLWLAKYDELYEYVHTPYAPGEEEATRAEIAKISALFD